VSRSATVRSSTEAAGWGPVWILLGGFVACGGDQQPCTEPQCLAEQILVDYESDPEEATRALAALEDPVLQGATAVALLDRYPGRTEAVCAVVREPTTQQFCTRTAKRPHLWVRAKAPATGARTAPGPLEARLTLPVGTASRFAQGAPAGAAALGCLAEPLDVACVSAAADDLVADDLDAAAAACRTLPDGRWRKECFFSAGEEAGLRAGPGDYADALELCAASEDFSDNCVSHITVRKAIALATAVCAGDPAAWASLVPWSEAVSAAWMPHGEPHRDAAVGTFWAVAFDRAHARAPALGGDAADHVPSEALPQLRGSLAWRLLELEGEVTRDLDAWATRLMEVMELRVGIVEGWRVRGVRVNSLVSWPLDRDEAERALPATIYRVGSRRVWSEDPHTDAVIVILEAAARGVGGTHAVLLDEGRSHADPLVRFTAERLSELKTPGRGAGPPGRPGPPSPAPETSP